MRGAQLTEQRSQTAEETDGVCTVDTNQPVSCLLFWRTPSDVEAAVFHCELYLSPESDCD